MKHCAGLDVSVKEISICIVDETGTVCREMKVLTHLEDIAQVLKDPAWRLERVGLEAGLCRNGCSKALPKRAWRSSALKHVTPRAFLKAQVNKTDRNDARGVALMMRVNLFRPVHVKTP